MSENKCKALVGEPGTFEHCDTPMPCTKHMWSEELGRRLAQEGWKQISRKHRMIARVPPGMTGMEALAMIDPEAVEQLKRLMESEAADMVRRRADKNPLLRHCHLELDINSFASFRRHGGDF